MRERVRIGIHPLDGRFGGVYRSGSALCIGTRQSGKTLVGLHFVAAGLRAGERSLLITDADRTELDALAALLTLDLARAIEADEVLLLGCNEVEAGPSRAHFEPIQRLLETHRLQRLVLDPVVPWIADASAPDPVADVTAFVDNLGAARTTSLLTLPWATQLADQERLEQLRDLVPVCFTLRREADGTRPLSIRRYLGEQAPASELQMVIEPGLGLVSADL